MQQRYTQQLQIIIHIRVINVSVLKISENCRIFLARNPKCFLFFAFAKDVKELSTTIQFRGNWSSSVVTFHKCFCSLILRFGLIMFPLLK